MDEFEAALSRVASKTRSRAAQQEWEHHYGLIQRDIQFTSIWAATGVPYEDLLRSFLYRVSAARRRPRVGYLVPGPDGGLRFVQDADRETWELFWSARLLAGTDAITPSLRQFRQLGKHYRLAVKTREAEGARVWVYRLQNSNNGADGGPAVDTVAVTLAVGVTSAGYYICGDPRWGTRADFAEACVEYVRTHA